MASGKRRGKVMERHWTKVPGAITDEPCTEGSPLKGGGGPSGFTAARHEPPCTMELMIGDMIISINAELPSPVPQTSPREARIKTGEAGERGLSHFQNARDAIEASQLPIQHSDVSPSDYLNCPLCSKAWACETSRTCHTFHTETCKHEFCTDCYTNLIKGSLLRLSLKSTTLEDIISALQCPVDKCGQPFTYLDIEQALGPTALHQFQDVIVHLFSSMFGASWRKECPQCSTQNLKASLVSATDLETLSLAEVYRAMESRGLPVSGRSKEQGIRDLENVTGALVASPWRLMCLVCDCVQCEACGLQVQGPTSPSSGSSSIGAIEDFGIILQGREITHTHGVKPEGKQILPTAYATGTTHRHCEDGRKQCYSVYCAAMEIGLAHSGNKHSLCMKRMKTRAKDAAVWPVDGCVLDGRQQPGGYPVLFTDKTRALQCVPGLPCDSANMVSDTRVAQRPAGDLLKVLLPTVKSDLRAEDCLGKEQESSIVEVLLQRPKFGTDGCPVVLMTPTELLHPSSVPPMDTVGFMNTGSILSGGGNLNDYWGMKAATWMLFSDYWLGESERFADASEWWDAQCCKWAGRSDDMAKRAMNWANNEAHWSQSAERVAAANKLWGYKIQEMSQLCSSLAQTGNNGTFHPGLAPRLERVESSPSNPPSLEVMNLRTRSDVEEYADSLGADTEWISPVECEVERWSTASNVSVPSTSVNSSPSTRGSSLFGPEPASADGGMSVEPKVASLDRSVDEKLMNALWDLTDSLEVNAALGVKLCAPAAYFLWGFEPLRTILCSLLQSDSLADVMSREGLYSEVFFLLRAISVHSNILPILFMPNSVEGTKKNCVFEAFKNLHQQAEDMLSEALVKVENDHDATQKNVNLIGDMEDAFEIVQGSLVPSFFSRRLA